MKIIGLTGTIGSGKSTVAGMFRKMGATVIDADKIVSGLYKKNFFIKVKLVEQFGEEVLDKNNKINRKKLGEIVFKSGKKLKRLNRIVHPFVFAEIRRRIKERKKGIVVIDVPLLIESKMQKLIDCLVVVKAKRTVLMQRLKRVGYSETEARQRITSQLPLREKIKFADYVIDNSSSISNTHRQVKKIYKKLEGGAK